MDTENAEGAVQEVAGKVQGAASALVGDYAAQLAGKVREFAGKAQQLHADATNVVHETTATNAFATLAAVTAVSFLAGAIWRAGGIRRDDP
ncbi:CsbD family protein [Burkholderia sp. R-69980]|nr:CsbD family protein [Burkholderia sp. R-69980]